ncbi:hypothetical protein HMF8227_00693 [Saliniradius amylolyticus]|uniref:Uncharacterized protein n=1 Tax=Saliniradius amylolyticus TaxID=2183582 RepID=A0A2S2E0R9_9ALTE|nr:hypothetical protein HMF8227_00693 [Saliniradius amylolyticus]
MNDSAGRMGLKKRRVCIALYFNGSEMEERME